MKMSFIYIYTSLVIPMTFASLRFNLVCHFQKKELNNSFYTHAPDTFSVGKVLGTALLFMFSLLRNINSL